VARPEKPSLAPPGIAIAGMGMCPPGQGGNPTVTMFFRNIENFAKGLNDSTKQISRKAQAADKRRNTISIRTPIGSVLQRIGFY
jgi:hypothetical protein